MKTLRRNYDKDRFIVLPNCLLLEILSHLNAKQAVQTCVLSTTWKNIWKDLPVLSLNSSYFKTIKSFTNFVSQILSLRNDRTSLQSLNFQSRLGNIKPHLLKRILDYASSPNLQLLHLSMACNIQPFSLCNFSSHTLTSLNLTSYRKNDSQTPLLFPNSLILPALTYLSIHSFSFCSGDDGYAKLFSAFKCLNTLIILSCQVLSHKKLSISSVSLVNFTIKACSFKFELSTPNLCSFCFRGLPLQKKLCARNSNNNFSSIKNVNIVIPIWTKISSVKKYPSILFNWLAELSLMKSLTICPKTLEILDLIPDSSKVDFPYLHNLKLLKIYELSSITNGMGEFLLQNAPSAKKVIKHLPRTSLDALITKFFPREFCISRYQTLQPARSPNPHHNGLRSSDAAGSSELIFSKPLLTYRNVLNSNAAAG
ncbi:hypothetical protein RYX36_007066 [Vicia faba]